MLFHRNFHVNHAVSSKFSCKPCCFIEMFMLTMLFHRNFHVNHAVSSGTGEIEETENTNLVWRALGKSAETPIWR